MLAWIVVGFALIVCIGMTLLLVTVAYHLIVLRCPFVPTSAVVAKEMVSFAGLQGTERVYDLGAGDGAVLIAAKRAHPGIRATGIECVITVWWLGKLRIWLSRQDVALKLADAFQIDVSDAEVVLLYLTPHVMEKLEGKLVRELRPGTIVVSHAFRFPNRAPTEEKRMPSGALLLRYVW